MPIDALSVLCAQLTRNLLAIAKFLFFISFFVRKNLFTGLELRLLNQFCHVIHQKTRMYAG